MESKIICILVFVCAIGQVAPQATPTTTTPATTTAAMPIVIPIQIPAPTQTPLGQAPFGQFGQALGFAAGQFVTAPKRVLAGFITGLLNNKVGGTAGTLPLTQLPINPVTQLPVTPIPINPPIAIPVPVPGK